MQVNTRPILEGVAAKLALDDTRQWLVNRRLSEPDDVILCRLHAAYINMSDAYAAARAFEKLFHWPSDFELVKIIDAAMEKAVKTEYPRLVKEWVVATGVRFPAKPHQTVSAKLGDDSVFTGVVEVVLEATAEAVLKKVVGGHIQQVRVTAESILPEAA